MASWRIAPATTGRNPSAAAAIATIDIPIPRTTLWTAIERARRAIWTASVRRSSRSTVMTMSAASEEALAPRAPIATPTSARARAGASLSPSPTITIGPEASDRSAWTASTFSAGDSVGKDGIDADGRPDDVGDGRVVAGDHHDPGEADPPERADRPWGLGAERVVEDQGAADHVVDPHEGARRTLDRGTAPDVARPSRQPTFASTEIRRPHRDPPAVNESGHAGARRLDDVARHRQFESPFAGALDDRAGEHVRRQLLDRGRQPKDLALIDGAGSVAGPTSIVANLGRPAVSVPVLSNRMTRARARVSSGPPPLTITPRRAAREIPATIAIGAASRSGHGVATTRTARARTGSPDTSQAAAAMASVNGTKIRAYRSARRTNGALLCCASWTRRTMPGVRAVGRGRDGTEIERRAGVDRPRGDRLAFLAGHQPGLAGEGGLVEHGRAPDDHAIDRHDLAGADRKEVAGDDGLDRGRLEPAIDVSLDVARRPSEEGGQFAVGATLRIALQRLAGRQHDADDRGGERLAEQERPDDRQDRDEVDAELAVREVAQDRPREPDRHHDRRDRPGDASRLVVSGPCERQPGHEAHDGHRQDRALDQTARRVDRVRGFAGRPSSEGAARRWGMSGGPHRPSLRQGSRSGIPAGSPIRQGHRALLGSHRPARGLGSVTVV